MANDLNLGDLKITLETLDDAPVRATFGLPDGSVVARNFPQNGELVMRLGLGLGLTHSALSAPPALGISGTPVLTATEGEAYAGFTATGSGGEEPYTYSLVGTWMAGVSINSSTGEVSGTPTESGTFASLSVRVTDGNLDTADLDTFTIEVEAAAPDLTVASTYVSVSNEVNPKTLSTQALGAYHASRRTILSIQWRNSSSRTLDTVTVGGASAARLVRAIATATTKNAEIWALDTGAGTALEGLDTADIVLTANGASCAYTIAVYRGVALDVVGSDTAQDTTDPVVLAVTVPADGVAVAVAANGSLSAAAFDVVTEALNQPCPSATRGIHGYSLVAGELATTLSGTVSLPLGVAVAFGPS